ncbi:uncharacterized protein [Setaria viridis]|uniref:uncharacterized protein n=1 Tax=Setaria viridis TaxID=4556 RepID=UPI003B3A3E82
MVSQCGIQANLVKVDAIKNMAKPSNKKDVMKLTGMMAALSRFISKLGEKGLPFFKLLKKADKFEWDDEASKALEELKAFLSPPGHDGPNQPRNIVPLHLRNDARCQHLAHKIHVVSSYPIGEILPNKDVNGRVIKWSVELGEFDLDFSPRHTIKSQILVDFVALWTEIQKPLSLERPEHWTIAEYEALIHGLYIAVSLGIKRILAYNDFKVVIKQVNKNWDWTKESMDAYYIEIHKLEAHFDGLEFHQVNDVGAEAPADPATGDIIMIEAEEDWRAPFIVLIADQIASEDKLEHEKLVRRSANDVVIGKELYRKAAFTGILMKCSNIYRLRPFACWGLDMVGPFKTAPGGYTHIFVAVDKFTKWIEVKGVTSVESAKAAQFMEKITYHFRVLRVHMPGAL